jgi:hypothetical protein
MGRQNEIIARAFATQVRKTLCAAEILFSNMRLLHPARFLRCVRLDAAMHNRRLGTCSEIGVDFGIEPAQHRSRLRPMSAVRLF